MTLRRTLSVAAAFTVGAIAGSPRLRGALTSHRPVVEPPLDMPKPVAEDVFVVDSVLPGLVGRILPVRMTVIRLPDGSLLLHSPTRFTEELRTALNELGTVRHLVAPNIAHWIFLQEWQRAFPDAVSWAAPGLRQRKQVREKQVRIDHELTEQVPEAWGEAITLRIVPGGLGFREVAMFHRASRTLLLTDLVLNLDPATLALPMRAVAEAMGVTAPDGMPPPYLRAAVLLRRQAAAAAAQRVLALAPDRVIFAHGRWFERDGTRRLRRSLRWLLGD